MPRNATVLHMACSSQTFRDAASLAFQALIEYSFATHLSIWVLPMKHSRAIHFIALVFCAFLTSTANAVSLSGKATDDSVCDLSPLTSYRLGTKTFVEAGTQLSDQIYTRLALRFITQRCKNNQVLILDSDDGSAFDAKYFREVSNHVCTIADVARVPNGTAEYPNGFQIKCRIAKMQEATDWLSSAESAKSTETMIAEGAPKHSPAQNRPSQPDSKDCSKINMATVFFGGGGCR